MGDNAEFEKLSTLEARLAAALDRIAVGLGEVQPALPPEDPGITSGAFEDALIRAEAAEARVAELEAYLAAEADRTDAADTMSLVTALEAKVEQLSTQLADRDASIASLHADLDAARAAQAAEAERDDEIDRLAVQVADLEARLARLRAERAEAIAERDEARDIAEELQAAGGMGPDDRNMALRAEVQQLRAINERLTKNVSRLRGENATDPTILNKALVVELDAIKAARASEAAELERILADLDRAGAGEGAHA